VQSGRDGSADFIIQIEKSFPDGEIFSAMFPVEGQAISLFVQSVSHLLFQERTD
jgi:hypothetical protein